VRNARPTAPTQKHLKRRFSGSVPPFSRRHRLRGVEPERSRGWHIEDAKVCKIFGGGGEDSRPSDDGNLHAPRPCVKVASCPIARTQKKRKRERPHDSKAVPADFLDVFAMATATEKVNGVLLDGGEQKLCQVKPARKEEKTSPARFD